MFSLSVLVLQQLPLVGQRSKCNIDQSPELNCRSQGDSFKLVLSSRTMGVCLESPVLWTFFFFPSVQYNSDIKCIVYILNSFGPKTRRIKEIKLPFVPTVGTFFSPKHPSILNLFSSPETRQWPRSLSNHYSATGLYISGVFLRPSAVDSVVRLNCQYRVCSADIQRSNSNSANRRLTGL